MASTSASTSKGKGKARAVSNPPAQRNNARVAGFENDYEDDSIRIPKADLKEWLLTARAEKRVLEVFVECVYAVCEPQTLAAIKDQIATYGEDELEFFDAMLGDLVKQKKIDAAASVSGPAAPVAPRTIAQGLVPPAIASSNPAPGQVSPSGSGTMLSSPGARSIIEEHLGKRERSGGNAAVILDADGLPRKVYGASSKRRKPSHADSLKDEMEADEEAREDTELGLAMHMSLRKSSARSNRGSSVDIRRNAMKRQVVPDSDEEDKGGDDGDANDMKDFIVADDEQQSDDNSDTDESMDED